MPKIPHASRGLVCSTGPLTRSFSHAEEGNRWNMAVGGGGLCMAERDPPGASNRGNLRLLASGRKWVSRPGPCEITP
jgi:hypothetical protein